MVKSLNGNIILLRVNSIDYVENSKQQWEFLMGFFLWTINISFFRVNNWKVILCCLTIAYIMPTRVQIANDTSSICDKAGSIDSPHEWDPLTGVPLYVATLANS
jgi:hypothetical protein